MWDSLRCPYCRGPFDFDECTKPDMARAEFGLLRCSCSVFPVIDGIPIVMRDALRIYEHTTGAPETDAVEVDELAELIRRGATQEALLQSLTAFGIPAAWRKALGWRLSRTRIVKQLSEQVAKKRFERQVLAQRDSLNAPDVLEYYYRTDGPLNPDVGHYFIQRLTQPRHLAALSLAAAVAADSKPVVDIACGVGHLAHYFNCRQDRMPVTGVDLNFFQLWIARHFMAPQSHFVCANVNDGLPFKDDCFSATFCSDAYHYIRNYALLLGEVGRCAPGRMVTLTRVGNASVTPNEGFERSLDTYLAEFPGPVRAFHEAELTKCYLRRSDPFDTDQVTNADLRERKWLSFTWNVPAAHRSIKRDAIKPHAVGRIGINPIYTRSTSPDGGLRLRFDFPTAWYAYENHRMLEYHPLDAMLSAEQLSELSEWQEHESLRELVDSFVLIGFPP